MAMLIEQNGKQFRLKNSERFKFVYVFEKGISLFTQVPFRAGEDVSLLRGEPVDVSVSSPQSVQIDGQSFLDTEYLVEEDFINHSCDPNTMFDMSRKRIVAIKNIPPDSEITYNYLTTEWDLKEFDADFQCKCGSPKCMGHIRGFRYLSRPEREALKPLLSPFLRSKLCQN